MVIRYLMGKITVKPFLNTHLKPEAWQDTEPSYPLYYQVTFKRKNTQIKSLKDITGTRIHTVLHEHNVSVAHEIAVLEHIVRYEYARLADMFELKGLGQKFELYSMPLLVVLHQFMAKKMLRALSLCNSEFKDILRLEHIELKFSTIYKAVKILIPDFNRYISDEFKEQLEAYKALSKCSALKISETEAFPLIYWLDKTYIDQIFPELVKNLNENSKIAEKYMVCIDEMIADRLKQLF